MASSTTEVVHEILPFLRVYKDGRVERLVGTDVVPPSVDPEIGVQSKDVVIAPETGVSARLFLPKTANPDHKLPLVVYFHGGGFLVQTPFNPLYHNHVNSIAAKANVVVVSVDYRLAPEHPVPIALDDSWVAIKWVASHATGGGGDEPWLKDHVDFQRVFFAGDSAGGNIAHNMAMRFGSEKLDGIKLVGIVLKHPFLWGKEPIGAEAADTNAERKAYMDNIWRFVCPTTSGSDDPLINPAMNPKLSSLGCTRVLICVGEKDVLRDRGWYYHDQLGKCGWEGKVEILESKGEDHVFYLFNPSCDNAVAKLKRVASFLQDKD